MSPLLDKQRHAQIIGRIRTGYRGADSRPVKSKTFLFTTGNRRAALAVADLFGGTPRDWAVRPGELIVKTEVSEFDVMIPPRDEIVSQWYEMWTKAGCAHRCDSRTDRVTNKPCVCPSDPVERARLAKLNPPKACKPRTRISVMVPDLPGMGVWMLATGSDQAACEVEDATDLMTMARNQGIFLPATLRLEQRETNIVGEPLRQYGVPVLEPHNTMRQIVTGELENATVLAQLPPVPQARLALTMGTAGPRVDRSVPVAGPPTADTLVARAQIATTRAELKAIAEEATQHALEDEYVCTDAALDVHEVLRDFITHRWNELPATAAEVS